MRAKIRTWVAAMLMRVDRAFPLSFKFLTPFIALLAIGVGTVALIEYRSQRDQIDEGYVQRGEILARALAASLEDPRNRSYLDDTLALQQHVEYLLTLDPDILRVNIHMPDERGTFVAASSDTLMVGTRSDAVDARPFITGAFETGETKVEGKSALEISFPIRVDGKTVAAMGVYTSLAERDAALSSVATRLVAGPIAAVILAAFLVWLGLQLLVLRRVKWMVRAGERLAKGDMTARVAGRWDNPGRDEMALAVHQFNGMAESIQTLTGRLEQLGLTDALTGVYNRRFFDESLAHEIRRGDRVRTSVALLMADIDHFKRYNDRFGHQAGDEALRSVAQTLAREIRAIDIVARYGGEEFTAVPPGADTRTALAVAERVRAAVEAAGITGGSGGKPVTVSSGVGVYPEMAGDAVGLVAAADEALYAAKKAGRNRVAMRGAVDAPVSSVPR